MPFSPSSAGEGDSPAGSPDTRLTAPSPNDPTKRSVVSPKNQDIIDRDGAKTDKRITQFRPEQQREREKDPFVTPGRASKSGLSPTASAFSPFHIATESPNHTNIHIPVNMLSQSMGMSRWLKIVAEQIITPQQVKAWLQVGDYEFGRHRPLLMRTRSWKVTPDFSTERGESSKGMAPWGYFSRTSEMRGYFKVKRALPSLTGKSST